MTTGAEIKNAYAGRRGVVWRSGRPLTRWSAFWNDVGLAASVEVGQLGLWTPVVIGAGAMAYFSLKNEPPMWLAPAALILFVSALFAWRATVFRRTTVKFILVACALMMFGFAIADWRTGVVSAPILERDIGFAEVTGRVLTIEDREKDQRLTLAPTAIERLSVDALPAKIRVTWRGEPYQGGPGALVTLRASLSPPPPPAAPGSFNFAQQLYYYQIGAVGFMVSTPIVIDPQPEDARGRRAAFVERMRVGLARRIMAAAPGQGGAIVAAVVTGKRGAINDQSQAALRDSGLAHLLAISGLHMGLATGLIFFTIRFLLAAIPAIALRFPVKKLAAAIALVSGFGYLILSGGGWSARRAFIMTAVIFLAILVDRRALSLRNVAIAALIILLSTPEAVLHPGFQMSFAAVTALIAFYEWARHRSASRDTDYSVLGRFKQYAIGIGVTDTIAALATAPYSLYHFNRAAIYSLPANLAAMPLMAFWIMPAAVVALALTPFGLDGWAWRLSAAGVDQVLASGGFVSGLNGAVFAARQAPPIALGIATLGGLIFCLLTTRLRWVGLLLFPCAILTALQHPKPVAMFSGDGDNAAVVQMKDDGPRLLVFNKRKDRFAQGVWMEAIGINEISHAAIAMKKAAPCDGHGCVVVVDGRRIAISADPVTLPDDCARADVVMAVYALPRSMTPACGAALITRRDAWAGGTHAVYLHANQVIRIENVTAHTGNRPWAVR